MNFCKVFMLSLIVAISATQAFAQFNPQAQRREALAQPFAGITNDGEIREGLFDIEETGISTAPVIMAAEHLIASLSDEQREALLFPVDDQEWRDWINIHRFPREGVSLEEMSPDQREAAYDLLRASLSARGYQTSRDIMRLNHHLGELVDNFDEYGELLYWFTIMGEPSATEPWGWQLDGHHLIINYFVLGDQIVMTPTFMGSEPVTARSGKYTGVSILQREEGSGLRLMRSLPESQQETAYVGPREGQRAIMTEAFKDNEVVPYQGLPASDMSEEHRRMLLDLIALYVGNIRKGHAEIKMEEVLEHFDDTFFAWMGETGDDSVFYYRIQSPVVLIEFDHLGTIALQGSQDVPTKRHIHTVVRTPNGNDYGKDLLEQHYRMHENDEDHVH